MNAKPLSVILESAVDPALLLLPRAMTSDRARIMLLAIGLQESKFTWRWQRIGGDPYRKGPARGYWQFELAGVRAVMSHDFTKDHLQALCISRRVKFDPTLIHARLEFDDILAAGLARLLLWADHRPLPEAYASHDETWEYYLRCWQPGKPRHHTWDSNHLAAQRQVLK